MSASPHILACGATFAAFGLASRYGDKVLVADRTTTVGGEFTCTFHPGTRWPRTWQSKTVCASKTCLTGI